MRFTECRLLGVTLVESVPHVDARGSFTRLHCDREFSDQGIAGTMVQTSLSRTARRGTVRGLHFQWPPAREGKLVRCLRGRIHDVLVDLRPASPGFGAHFTVELSAANPLALFVPLGVAHGFQTLEDDCEVLYQMTDVYKAELADGVRWNDPAFGIAWPLPCSSIHERDASYGEFDRERFARAVEERGGWSDTA